MSPLETLFASQLASAGLPTPERELVFSSRRRWRLDFAWPEHGLALEVDGGTWANGRHSRAQGFEADCEKLNAAALAGFRVLRVTGAMVRDGRALATLQRAFAGALEWVAA